jgi:transposase-like protein
MACILCGHEKTHKHGKTSKGSQRYFCPACKQSFSDTLDTIYYRRQLQPDEVHTILQSHCEGSSLRGVARISGRAYGTVVSLIRDASQKAQMMHNAFVQQVRTIAITADELWSFIQKNKNIVCLESLRWATAGLA